MRTLRSKLILLLVISALTPLIIFGALSLYNFQNSLRNSIEDSYREISSRTTEEIRLFLNHSQELLQTLAQDLAETNLTQGQSERIIENYVIRFPRFLKIILYSPNDEKIFSTSLDDGDADVPSNSLVDKAKGLDYLFSTPYLSEDLMPVFWFMIPLKTSENISGVIAAQIDLMQMWQWISDIRLGKNGYVSVVDEDGKIIASGNPDYKREILSSDKPVRIDGFDRDHISEHPKVSSIQGVSSLVSTKLIAEQPRWFLVLAQPTHEAFSAIRTITYFLIFLTLLFLFLMIFTAMIGSQKLLLNPMRELMKATEAIGRGDLTYQVKHLGKDELGQLGNSINQMGKDLAELQDKTLRQERMAMFGRMASGLAHDLKHPVKNIENAAQVMETMYNDANYRKVFTNIVTREFSRINQFLEDLRNLTHEMAYNPELFNLEALIREIMESFNLEAQKKSASLSLSLEGDFSSILGDPNLLRRIFENLVANALQALSESGKMVTIILSRNGERGDVRAEVRDNGPGILPERLPGLFDEFTTTKRKGLGLGLAIAKKIMSLHGGTITVKSEVGKGTSFFLSWIGK